jgi:hypothetical protein
MPQNKKVFANLFSRTRGLTDGHLKCVVEYVLLSGTTRSGKASIEIGPIRNEAGAQDDLKEALAAYLVTTYPGETFTSNDIAGLGV